ncbi:uncharacterized protein LOC116041278 isoform X2 [Sander lucioperca]|uniref:uncharacterized protein LOC116041278 isoform X2 n=1 Tax=Sander lucioperca TaxID=283035 RepID=UPI0016537464|nr:uncharacterized protein LOC116041278 isoform X2 [Sander lucioperca]
MAAAFREEPPIKEDPFRSNAFTLIEEMLDLSYPPSKYTAGLMDEILHSIFFLGKINKPPFSPEDILSDDEMLNALKGRYPQPFELYSSQLPRRSPFSCVLDMIVHLTRETRQGERQEEEIEREIIKWLQDLIRPLKESKKRNKKKPLVSSTICVSHSTETQNAVRYYGVSMSTIGPNPGKILIAASCFSSWDSSVAGAVMTYYPNKVKREYFDGTIILPEHVRCQAFNLFENRVMPPCRSCRNLFGLTTNENNEWPYGNCAEAESVSNLLRHVEEVREQAAPSSETCTEENRQKAAECVRKELEGFVRTERFKWKGQFYTPRNLILKRGNN